MKIWREENYFPTAWINRNLIVFVLLINYSIYIYL